MKRAIYWSLLIGLWLLAGVGCTSKEVLPDDLPTTDQQPPEKPDGDDPEEPGDPGEPDDPDGPGGEEPDEPENPGEDDGDEPDFDATIRPYEGERADDAAKDTVGDDADFYWEQNDFSRTVRVTYKGETATVESDAAEVLSHVDGARVTIDMQTNSVKKVEVIVSGSSDNGQLKIYGENKFKLTLAGLELTSTHGPAINDQCKKRVFVHLADGSTNRLTDAPVYTDDAYYLNGAAAGDEDRKGCFFSEGNLIFSGAGVLEVAGRQKHGLVTDGYLFVRPGVTIAVTEAAKNAIHVKGDKDDAIGIRMAGGLIYANVASEAGKCLKCDLHVEISGGRLDLNTSGNAVYDADEKDTSSAAGIKSDGDIRISGGRITVKSTGSGGKGLNADGSLTVAGGAVTVATSGGKYVYNAAQNLDSSPKGIKAEGDVVIDGGTLNITVTGVSDGSEAIESKSTLTINGGEVYAYAYDDAINAATAVTINGGRVYAYAVANDGIDSNGTLTLNGGLVIASGSSAPEEGFDCDQSSRFFVNGGILIGTGGAAVSPSSSSRQRSVIYNRISASKGDLLTILNSAGAPIMTYELPRSMNSMSLFFSSPDIAAGATYDVWSKGALNGATDSWNGWYGGGSWSGGSQIGSFTSNSVVTTVGGSTGPGGGGPGGPGGGRW